MKPISQHYLCLFIFFIIPTVSLANGVIIAPTYNDSGSSTNVNMGYGGVKWTLGESYMPEIVAGYRYASVTSSGATQGGDVSIAFKVTGKTQLTEPLAKLPTGKFCKPISAPEKPFF